ncbi:Dopamine receptor family,G protein-coupled receptor, rhodopsin-like,GPCR, rhodopsin-like, 7TM [Cinara cedri]|uniref:Dopamine receptor family,G protein-coupled receptor, rhodopsin-like,GPCR, rhodopsin-like, 7TM n=1 Tax=Cinara cedri TaxID=506608 RepID=A0A5E4MXP1_9HEMI|nr:Dopamine receptor family,G protein-coupled receptor, rhodopsin-like,GPCR, rhodopsin-like, 7TM [Cinara cedri]
MVWVCHGERGKQSEMLEYLTQSPLYLVLHGNIDRDFKTTFKEHTTEIILKKENPESKFEDIKPKPNTTNGTNGTPENKFEEKNDDALTALPLFCIGSFLIVVIFLSIAGNVLVCMAIYTDRGLRRIGNLFLASLAIADLFVGALVMTFALVNDLLGYWIFGAKFCDIWTAIDVMCSTASILNLCAISLDRYIHIKDPLRYTTYLNRRNALLAIAGVWALAAFVSVVPICILSIHKPPKPAPNAGETEHMTCALELSPEYAVISSCISFYIPCVVMIGIYCRLYCYAQKHVQSIRAVTRPLTTTTTTTTNASAAASSTTLTAVHHHTSPYHVSDHKAAITVGVIMGTFLLCWVPFFCVNIIKAFCNTCIPEAAFKVLSWLGYSNSAFNPIIYSIFNTEFRDAFRRILTTHYPDWCFCKGYRTVVLSSDTSIRHHRRKQNDFASSASATAIVAASAVVRQNGKAAAATTASATSVAGQGIHQQHQQPSTSTRSSVASLRQSRLNSSEKIIVEADEESSSNAI